MNRIFVTIILLSIIYSLRLRSKQPLTEISENMILALFSSKEKLYISTNGEKITTSTTLRANEQFKLIKSNDYWCFESNNYENTYMSLDGSTCTINEKNGCGVVSMNTICGDNEKFEIIHRVEIGTEYFSIRSIKYNLFLHIEKHLPSYEAVGNKGIVNGQSTDGFDILFEFLNATQGDII